MTTRNRKDNKASETGTESSSMPAQSTIHVPDREIPMAGTSAAGSEGGSQDEHEDKENSQQDLEDADFLIDEEMLKEEQQARIEREGAEKPQVAGALTKDKLKKLDILLDQAQMYSQFLVEQVATIQDQVQPQTGTENEKNANGKRKSRAKASKSSPKRAKGTSVSPTAAMLPLIKGDLRNYQLKGITWLISLWTNGMNGILADQMGLGKTVQTIGFLSHLRSNGINGPFLIVVPLSTLSNWKSEVTRWCPSMTAMVYHGTKEERMDMERKWFQEKFNKACPEDFPVIVTSYEIAIRDRKALQRLYYKYMVVDEGHRLKNSNCRLVRELKALNADNKLLLTGTPLQNNLAELWSLLNFLLPSVFNNLEDFESWFDFSAVVSSDAGHSETASREIMAAEAKNRMVSKLHDILKPFLLRRVKADVENSLPEKQEIILYAPQTAEQVTIQQKLVNKTLIAEVTKLASTGGKSVDTSKLHNIVMQLRKNCNHPDLLTSEWEQSTMFPPAETLVKQCGKMQLLDNLLKRLKAGGHKVLIFSQFTRMLDVLDAYLEDRKIPALRIDGSMSYKDRMKNIDDFNTDKECFVFLLSTRAGGLGINLTSADTVIIYDSDWNPHQDMQAMDRAHRIGQTRPVLVLRLCTSNSIEVKLLQRATSKLALERLVIKKGAFQHDHGKGADKQADGKADAGVSLSAEDVLDVLKGNLKLEGGKQESSIVSEKMLDQLLDRTHLAEHTMCPYPNKGEGYELVEQQSSGLLNSVQ